MIHDSFTFILSSEKCKLQICNADVVKMFLQKLKKMMLREYKGFVLHLRGLQMTILARLYMISRPEERVHREHNGRQRGRESGRSHRRQADLDQRGDGIDANAIHAPQNCTSPSSSFKRPGL